MTSENEMSRLDGESNNYSESVFESIKHINEYGQEFWYARELQYALEYASWAKFKRVLNKAKTACNNSEASIDDHFAQVGKMVEAGIAPKSIEDYELSRYACYLIVMNGDSKKAIIALGQTYFAVKTRQQELVENYNELSEDQKRLAIRREMKEHNKQLLIQRHLKLSAGEIFTMHIDLLKKPRKAHWPAARGMG